MEHKLSKKFKMVTLGCKVNQCESQALLNRLNEKGWQHVSEGETAVVCIVNTCTVTRRAAMQSGQEIRKMIKNHPDAVIWVTGCYAQTQPDEIDKIKGVHHIVGHGFKHQIADLVSRPDEPSEVPRILHNDILKVSGFAHPGSLAMGGRTRAFLKVQDGCSAFCSYCIVPFARGRSRSMPLEEVMAQMKSLKDYGYREVVLTGIHLGHYGHDLRPVRTLTELLRELDREQSVDRIRLSSIEPLEIKKEMIQLVAASDRFCRHFHIPLQSADNGILKRMSRPYTSGDVAQAIHTIREYMPDACIGLDVLVGFPGETVHAFEKTCSFIEQMPVSYLHVFPYSVRPGTVAAGFSESVSPEKIKKRAEIIRQIGKEKKQAFYRKMVGKRADVLVEGKLGGRKDVLKGITSNYVTVLIENQDLRNLKNVIVPVYIQRSHGFQSVSGKIIDPNLPGSELNPLPAGGKPRTR